MRSLNLSGQPLVRFLIPLGLLTGLGVLMQSQLLFLNETLILAVTTDLLLTVPLIYFLLIRKSSIPNTTVIPVMLIGLLVGSYLLPAEHQTYLQLFKTWALPAIEILALVFITWKVRSALKTYKSHTGEHQDFYDALKATCSEILPAPLVHLFATEVAVFYYGFVNWQQHLLTSHEFTYHKKSGTPALLGGLLLVIFIETIALHFLLELWSPVAAWILTGLSIYTAVQVLGFAKSLSKRPIVLERDQVLLRYGILNETAIAYTDVCDVNLSKTELPEAELAARLSPLGELESYNVVIRLKTINRLIGLYGISKQYQTLALYVDEPIAFKERLEAAGTASA